MVSKIFLICYLSVIPMISATIDLSNLDLSNFQYFAQEPEHRESPSGHPLLAIFQPITDKIQKTKSVLTYFKNVFFGNPSHTDEQHIEFDPNFGEAWKPHFEHHYGPRGENLVHLLGQGYSKEELQHYGAIDHDYHD